MRACLPWNDLPGQYDQRADSASQCLQLLSPEQARPKVACAKVYAIEGGHVTGEMMDAIAHHLINPVEARQAGMEKPETLEMTADVPDDVAVVAGFTQMSDKELSAMVARMGMAMSAEEPVLLPRLFPRYRKARSEMSRSCVPSTPIGRITAAIRPSSLRLTKSPLTTADSLRRSRRRMSCILIRARMSTASAKRIFP